MQHRVFAHSDHRRYRVLMEASKMLARRCDILTSVARTERSLLALDRVINGADCEHRMVALDWSVPDAFVRGVAAQVRQAEVPPSLIIAIDHPESVTIVGTVASWSRRP